MQVATGSSLNQGYHHVQGGSHGGGANSASNQRIQSSGKMLASSIAAKNGKTVPIKTKDSGACDHLGKTTHG